MNKPTRPDTLSRRRFIGRAAALAATTVVAGPALAQTAIEDIINSPRRGSWDDQFDAKSSRSVAATATRHPISSADTIAFVERAISTIRTSSPAAAGRWCPPPRSCAWASPNLKSGSCVSV
jgi:hypothetical protein